MNDEWYPIVDSLGTRAHVAGSTVESAELHIQLNDGTRVNVPRSLVVKDKGGIYRYSQPFARQQPSDDKPIVIPVLEEQVVVGKRQVERQHVRLNKTVSTREESVDVPLENEELHVERVPIGRQVAQQYPARYEGDTLIVPIYEEVAVVEKRLILKEEVRVTRRRVEAHHRATIPLRREDVTIESTPTMKPAG